MQMATLEQQDLEQQARLHGLIAVLGLPPLRHPDGSWKKTRVQIQLGPGHWVEIDGMVVEAERLLFWYGANGTRVEYVFDRDKCPPWKTLPQPRATAGFVE